MSLFVGSVAKIIDSGLMQWDSTVAPAALGQIGMDTTTGRLTGYVDGVPVSFAHTGDAGGGGSVSLIETVTVAGSAVSSITFSGLNGDVDKIYRLYWRINVSLTCNIAIRPNNLITSMGQLNHIIASNGTHTYNNSYTVPSIVDADLGICSGEMLILAETGYERHFNGFDNDSRSSGLLIQRQRTTRWIDTSTNITSLVVAASATGIGVGSYISLYKVVK